MNKIDLSELEWFKSSFSANGESCCTCARLSDGGMAVKDSKNPDGGILIFSRTEWQTFIGGVKLGEFG